MGLALFTPFWGNVWLSVTDRDYQVPADSSLLDFQSTKLNPGSGGWWVYGEDRTRFYAFTGAGSPPYRSIGREAALACRGFDPRDLATWCR
jgi:hypothetical protein